MENKTFGIVVGVIIALAVAMFAGLYMLGLTSQTNSSFNNGYEYDTTTLSPNETDSISTDAYDDFYFDEAEYPQAATGTEGDTTDFYFDEDGNAYNFDGYEFEDSEIVE